MVAIGEWVIFAMLTNGHIKSDVQIQMDQNGASYQESNGQTPPPSPCRIPVKHPDAVEQLQTAEKLRNRRKQGAPKNISLDATANFAEKCKFNKDPVLRLIQNCTHSCEKGRLLIVFFN